MSDRSRTPRIIALMNQKGGVGKTTSTVNLGAALAEAGWRVLLIDLDPQAHLTLHLGIDPAGLEHSVYDLLIDEDLPAASVLHEADEGLAVIPAEVDLAGAEQELGEQPGRQAVLKRKLAAVAGDYDFVLLDCPPSLGLLTLNALAAAEEVLVPMQAHFLALQGLSKLLETVQLVRQNVNTSLRVTGVVLCVHDAQTNLAGEVVRDLEGFFEASRKLAMPWSDAVIFRPPIRRNIRLAECPSFGQTVLRYAPRSAGATDYRRLARQLTGEAEPTEEDAAAGSAEKAANPPENPPDNASPEGTTDHHAEEPSGPGGNGAARAEPTAQGERTPPPAGANEGRAARADDGPDRMDGRGG